MANTPHTPPPAPPKPATPPPPPPKPSTPPPPPPKPEAAKPHRDEPPLPIGAKPTDPKDPQAQKFDPPPGPPTYGKPRDRHEVEERPHRDWSPKAAVDPRAETPPAGTYADGMTIADEQRARSAWIEEHGDAAYKDETDQRPDDERPVFDKNALAGGGAFVSQGGKKQIPGVTPPTKRE